MLLLGAGAVSAHDFWLVPDAFQVASGDALLVKGQTGTQFPGSISAVMADRIADARILSATGEEPLREFSVVGKSLGHAGTSDGDVSLPRLHPSDSTAVASVVTAFRAAVVRGDSAAGLALLAPDVRVLEAGGVEDLAEFRGHHLPADIAFARAVPSTTGPLHVTLAGSAAWVVSTSTTQGTFNGRTVNSVGAELVVLSKSADGRWQIRAIHWSSRRRS